MKIHTSGYLWSVGARAACDNKWLKLFHLHVGRMASGLVLPMRKEKVWERNFFFLGQAVSVRVKGGQRLANGSRFEETADNPTGNTEDWFNGGCGQRFSELFI